MRSTFESPILDSQATPLCQQVLDWILARDFPLPRLNRFIFKGRGNFWFLYGKTLEKLKREIPEYRNGSFTLAEDVVLLKRMKVIFVKV